MTKPKPKSKPKRPPLIWTCPSLNRTLTAVRRVTQGASYHLIGVLVRAPRLGKYGHDWWVLWDMGTRSAVIDPRTGTLEDADYRAVRALDASNEVLLTHVATHYQKNHSPDEHFFGAKALDGQTYGHVSIPPVGVCTGDARWRVALSRTSPNRRGGPNYMVWLHYVVRDVLGGYSSSVGPAYIASTLAEARAVQAQMLAWIAAHPARLDPQPVLHEIASAMPKSWPASQP